MATRKATTVEIGRNEVDSGLRIAVETAKTNLETAERALQAAHAERDALLANASGDIERDMILRSAESVVAERQTAVAAAQRMLRNRDARLRQAEDDAARSGDPVHVRFAEVAAERLREIVAGIPDNLGTLTVIPVNATRQRHYLSLALNSRHNNGYSYGGKLRIVATTAAVSAYTWRAVMTWALQGFGDQRNDSGQHRPAQITYPDDFAVELDAVLLIDREGERQAWQEIQREQAEVERLAAMGYAVHDAVSGGAR